MSSKGSFQMTTHPLPRSLFSQQQQICSQGKQVSYIKHKLQGLLEHLGADLDLLEKV